MKQLDPFRRKQAKETSKHLLSEFRTITLPGSDFQPSKADMEQEYDMPGISLDKIRDAFFRPFNIRREDAE